MLKSVVKYNKTDIFAFLDSDIRKRMLNRLSEASVFYLKIVLHRILIIYPKLCRCLQRMSWLRRQW